LNPRFQDEPLNWPCAEGAVLAGSDQGKRERGQADAPWPLSSLLEKLLKIGAKVAHHALHTVFPMAEVAVPRELFERILRLIDELQRRPAPA
jgi:hypothetical protein